MNKEVIIAALMGAIATIGAPLLASWRQSVPAKMTKVEACDETLRSRAMRGEYSGVYVGLVWDGTGEAEVQLMIARNGDTIQGSYFRAGLCGTVLGEVVQGKMIFRWRWADARGMGIATQEGSRLAATSGFGQSANGNTLVFFQR